MPLFAHDPESPCINCRHREAKQLGGFKDYICPDCEYVAKRKREKELYPDNDRELAE